MMVTVFPKLISWILYLCRMRKRNELTGVCDCWIWVTDLYSAWGHVKYDHLNRIFLSPNLKRCASFILKSPHTHRYLLNPIISCVIALASFPVCFNLSSPLGSLFSLRLKLVLAFVSLAQGLKKESHNTWSNNKKKALHRDGDKRASGGHACN